MTTTLQRTRKRQRRQPLRAARGSAAAFTPTTRAKLMLLSYGIEICERDLCNIAGQLRHVTAALAEIIHKTKPQNGKITYRRDSDGSAQKGHTNDHD